MKKVSLRELVADKIIFSILIAMYYWMWTRNDWKDYLLFLYELVDPAHITEFIVINDKRNGCDSPA